MAEGGEGEDEIQFLRTVSTIPLASTWSSALICWLWRNVDLSGCFSSSLLSLPGWLDDNGIIPVDHRDVFHPKAFDEPRVCVDQIQAAFLPIVLRIAHWQLLSYLQSVCQEVDSSVGCFWKKEKKSYTENISTFVTDMTYKLSWQELVSRDYFKWSKVLN